MLPDQKIDSAYHCLGQPRNNPLDRIDEQFRIRSNQLNHSLKSLVSYPSKPNQGALGTNTEVRRYETALPMAQVEICHNALLAGLSRDPGQQEQIILPRSPETVLSLRCLNVSCTTLQRTKTARALNFERFGKTMIFVIALTTFKRERTVPVLLQKS